MSHLDNTDNRWELDLINNPATDSNDRKKQFALHMWREDFRHFQGRKNSKRNDMNLLWTGVYQMVEFLSVFQGVLFQGVTQLPTHLSCGFYILIPISVFASAATIIVVGAKFSRVQRRLQSFYRHKLESKVRASRISACVHRGHEFNLEEFEKESDETAARLRILYKRHLVQAHRIRVGVIVALVVFSSLFASLIFVIMLNSTSKSSKLKTVPEKP